MPLRILVTGANGFVGNVLCLQLHAKGYRVCGAVRQSAGLDDAIRGVDYVAVSNIGATTDWQSILDSVDCVVHLAARVHIMIDSSNDPAAEFRSVNTLGSERLAYQAALAGVTRFIYLSSIKVNGEYSVLSTEREGLRREKGTISFVESDMPHPLDSYAVSKWEAEQRIRQVAKETDMEVVIIRPPLVYGPGVKANFHKMMHWLAKGIPLPLGAVHNKRTLVALDNLVDLIVTCVDHPAAANQVFLAGDGEDLSTTELLQRLGKALGTPARLIPVPQGMLEFALKMLAKGDMAQRLCGSLQVDISKSEKMLGWVPPVSVDEGLKRTAEWYWQQER